MLFELFLVYPLVYLQKRVLGWVLPLIRCILSWLGTRSNWWLAQRYVDVVVKIYWEGHSPFFFHRGSALADILFWHFLYYFWAQPLGHAILFDWRNLVEGLVFNIHYAHLRDRGHVFDELVVQRAVFPEAWILGSLRVWPLGSCTHFYVNSFPGLLGVQLGFHLIFFDLLLLLLGRSQSLRLLPLPQHPHSIRFGLRLKLHQLRFLILLLLLCHHLMNHCILLSRLKAFWRYFWLIVASLRVQVTVVVALAHLQRCSFEHSREPGRASSSSRSSPVVYGMHSAVEVAVRFTNTASLSLLVQGARTSTANSAVYFGGSLQIISINGSLDSRARLRHTHLTEASSLLEVGIASQLIHCQQVVARHRELAENIGIYWLSANILFGEIRVPFTHEHRIDVVYIICQARWTSINIY